MRVASGILRAVVIVTASLLPIAVGVVLNQPKSLSNQTELARIHGECDQIANECAGKFKDKKPTYDEIEALLKDHQKWLGMRPEEKQKNENLRANLCQADLTGFGSDGGPLEMTNADLDRLISMEQTFFGRASKERTSLELA